MSYIFKAYTMKHVLTLSLLLCSLVFVGASCSSSATVGEESSDDAMMAEQKDAMMDDTHMEDDAMMEEQEDESPKKVSIEVGEDGSMVMIDAESGSQERVFNVTGKNFSFSEEKITVKEGDTVTINFTSESGFHDWVVDEFDAATAQVNTGGSTSVTFVADKKGEFEYYCSVGQHRANGMVGMLIVE